MLYVTGDLHAMQRKWFEQIEPVLAPGDTLFVCGDFGVGFWGTNGRTEEAFLTPWPPGTTLLRLWTATMKTLTV